MFKRFAALLLLALIATKAHVIPTGEGRISPGSILSSTRRAYAATNASSIPTGTPLSAAGAAVRVPGRQDPSTADDYTTHSLSLQEEKLMNLINLDRQAHGLAPLAADPELSRIARIKSEDMRDRGYFAHESPTYGRARQMLERFGYEFLGCGENIAHHATVEKAQAAFMSSEGHRRNILSAVWDRVGVGVCYDANGFVYATQIFAR